MCLVKKGVHSNMNKIFKVVWSKTKECYVVVSEVAKNNGGKKKALASVLAGLAMVAATAGAPVHANVNTGGSAVNISPDAYNGSNTTGRNSVVVGYQNRTDNHDGTIAIGAANTATENSAMALGNGNTASGGAAVAMGAYNQATGRASVAIGNVSMASAEDSIAIGNRANSNPANQDRGSGQYSIAMGRESWARGTDNISIGHNATTDSTGDSIAIGRDSTSNSVNTVTIGAQTKATGGYAVAIGRESEVNANFATAMGYQSKAKGSASIAIGKQNNSNLGDTITMGNSNTANTMGGIAIGKNNIADSSIGDPTTATKENSQIAIGLDNKATSQDTVAIGREAESTKTGAVSLGARTKAKGDYAVAIGSASQNKTVEAADYAVAVGAMSKANGDRSVAIGGGAETTAGASRSVAQGYKSSASVADGVALGSNSKATVDKGVKGFNPAETRTNKYSGLAGTAQTSTLAAVSVGDGATATRQITGLAAGTNDTDAVNVAQLRSVNLKYAGDTGNGDVLLDDGTLKIKGDDPTFISTSADKNGVTVKAKIGADITNTNGKAVAPTTNGIATTDNVAKAINESGWNVVSSNNGGSVTGTQAAKKVSPGDTVTLSAGKNIVLDQTDKQFTYSLNKDVDLTKDGSLTIGDTKVNNDGLTITGGPSVTKTGIDAGNKNITNVKAGVNDTDAVNVKQLKDAKTKLVDGKNTKVTGEGTQDDPYKVNVEGDLKGITSISNADNGPKMTIGGNSINITGGPLNMGGSKITNVAPGTDDTDAVNVKQLKSAKTEVKAGNGVTVAKSQDATDGHDIYTVSSTGATGNTDPSKVEGGKNTTVTGDGTAATPYKVNVQGDLKDISSITNGDGSGKISFAGDQVVKVEGDNPISLDGKGGYVTGLQNKDWDITNPTVVSGRAATEDQLKKVSDGFNNTIKLAGNTGNTDTQKFNKTGGLSFGVVGANNGQYIKTTASGTDVVADLSDDAKAKLNHTFEVAPGSNNVTVSKDTTDPNKTVYKVAVANTTAGAASTESVVKKAAATGDTNLADIAVENGKNSGDPDAQYSVNVSRNAVKDAAREAVTVNNGGTTTGGNYTADADNPITVNPVKDDAKHNTTYEVKFDGEKAAKQIPLTYKANGTGDQTVKLDKGLNFTNGSNTTASVAADGVVKYDLNKDVDLTKNGSLTIGDTKVNNDGVTITGGPSVKKDGINAGNQKITNVKPATDGTDAVNYDQLKAARTVVTSNDKSVTINKTENGDQVTYDLHVNAAAGTASTWNLKSGAVSATEGTHAGDTAQNIADGKSVTMQAGKNLTVKQTNDAAGNTEVAYALDKDLKDLDSVTTKEVKLGDKNDNISIKKDGDRITYSTDGGTTVKKVANLDDEKHIKPGSYAVQNDGSVTMTYVDGNGKPVTGEEAKITGIAKNDLSNITDDGKKVITGLGSKVKAGDNVTVTDTTDATTGQKTYTVNAKLAKIENGKNTTKTGTGTDADPYKINVEGDLTDINSITNGAGSGKLTFGPNETVTVGGTNPITLNAKTGNIGGLTNKTFDPTNIVSGQAATEDQLKSVHDTLKASELHIAPTAVKTGSTEAKGGVVNGTENVYKYDAGTKKVTLTYNDGNGKAVTDTKAVIDFSDLNIPAAGNNYSFKTNATGNIENNGTATETEVPSGKTVNFGAGKNLTIKQDVTNGNQTYTYALNKDLTNLDKVVVNGKDGKDGEDGVSITGPTGAAGTDGNNGKVGITGKDGKDAVSISGKDGVGHIGLTGPAGKDGKNVTADITVKEGKAGVDGKDGVDGITRIFYNDKDGKEHQVATHDDGMKFAGDDGQANQDTNAQVIKKHLNNVVDIIGGADKTKLTTANNIGVNNVNGKLKVQLAKNVDLDADGSLTTGATKVDNNGVTITAPTGGTTTDVKLTKDGLDNGGNKIVNVKAGEADTDAVNVKQLKDKVTTVESSDSSIKVVDKNVAGQPGYDAAKGHQYDITINNQTVVEKAQTPVVYTNKDGDKLYKIVDPATGNVTFNTKPDGTGTTVQPADVIASMNNGGDSTTTPMKLNNVGSTIADQAGNTYLDKIDAAAADNKTKNGAVNVTDLKNTADALIEKGLKFDANSGGVKTNKLGSTVKIQGEGNKADTEYSGENVKTIIGQDADGNTTIDVKLDKNLKADSVVVGKDGKDGVDGKIGVNGKDGASVVLNGKDGSIGLTGPKGADGKDGASAKISVKDGVPGVDGQPGDKLTRIVYEDKDGNTHEVATHDDGMKFAGDDGQTDPTKVIKKHLNNVVDIVGGADKAKLTDNNIGVNNDNGKLKVQLSKDIDLTKDGSVKIGDTKVNNDGLTINGGPSVKKDGINAGDKKITGVKAGEDDTDAVNVKQLKDKVTTVESSDGTISVTDKNDPTSATYDAAKGHQYDIKINSQGVVNNAQIPVVYTKQDGTKVYKQPDGTFNTAKDGSGDVVNAGDIIASMNNPNASTTDPMKLNNVGSSIADKAGNTFLDKIDAAAADNNTKNGAVNVTDLKNTADAIGNKGLNFGTQSTGANSEIHKNLGEKLEIVGEGTKADDNYSASNIKTMTKDGKVVIGLDKDLNGLNSIGVPGKDGVAGKDGVSISGKDGANGIDGKVSIGKDGKDAVSIAGKDGVGHIGLTGPQGPAGADGTGVDISTDHGSKTLVKPEANNGDKSERIVYVPKDKDGNPLKDTDGNPIKREVATMDDGLKFTGNNTGTENKHALNTLVKVQGEGVTAAQSTAFQSAAGNINVVADGNDTLTVKLNKDLKGINSIKNSDNGPALNFNAGDLSVTGGNLNMGGNKITNLGKGTNDTDAVNLKQLKDSRTIVKSTDGSVGVRESESADGAKVYDLSTGASPRFDELTDEIGRVGAQGAALAALKPIQYDPLEPTQIMAGYGNYRGNSAIAMGVAHYKNESTMMHAGLAWAGGSRHMMANAGVTWKVGNRDSEAAVADRYRKGPISSAYAMQQEMASVKAQNAGLKTEVSDLKAENEQMKAQIAAMMAKLGM